MKNFIYGLLLISSINAFAQEQLHIKGNIKGLSDGNTVLFLVNSKEQEAKVKDGLFDIAFTLEQSPSSVSLLLPDYGYKSTSIFVGNETIELNGSIDDFPQKLRAKGSKFDTLRYELYLLNKSLEEQLNALEDEFEEQYEDGVDMETLKRIYMNETEPFGKIVLVEQQIAANDYLFLKEHINTAYGQYLLQFSVRMFNVEQLKTLLSLVNNEYKNSPVTKFMQALIDYPALKEGDNYYNFSALDANEKEVNFKSFFDGRYVLLDFSTYHCGYCQIQAPLTAELASSLKEKMNFVTYYVDGDKEGVDAYVELKGNANNLVWNKEGRFNSTRARYRLDTTPSYVLFDPKGKQIATFVGTQNNFKELLLSYMK